MNWIALIWKCKNIKCLINVSPEISVSSMVDNASFYLLDDDSLYLSFAVSLNKPEWSVSLASDPSSWVLFPFLEFFYYFYQQMNIFYRWWEYLICVLSWTFFLWCHTSLWLWVTHFWTRVFRQGGMIIITLWVKVNMFWCSGI